MRLRTNKNSNNTNSFCSRNCNDEKHHNNKYSKNYIQNNTNTNDNKTLKLDGKKIIFKKDRKIIISPITRKYKKDINIPKGNTVKTENINYINSNNYIFNDEQNSYIYKNKIQEYRKECKYTNNIIKSNYKYN